MKINDIQEITKGLYLIPLDQDRRGFRDFISSWVYQTDRLTVLVDPGPKATIPVLLKTLSEMGITHLDYILLTHIHIDHAGGTGLVCREFPDAKVVCHVKGIKHLIDPAKLWEGSKNVLGDLADVYGEVIPVEEDRLLFTPEIDHYGQSIICLETPGHAPHHVSYIIDDVLFSGEVAGMFDHLRDGSHYLRPATPPVFHKAPLMASIDRLAQEKAAYLCFGHFGAHRDSATILSQARDQLELWVQVIQTCLPGSMDNIMEKAFHALIEKDPLFALFDKLDPDKQDREKYFFGNTVQGILGFLSDSV